MFKGTGTQSLKGKSGENPARSRHCDRGRHLQDATGKSGKAQMEEEPRARRPACFVLPSHSRKVCGMVKKGNQPTFESAYFFRRRF